jgi:hypothetical protein
VSDIAATDAVQQAVQQAVSPTATEIAYWINNSWGRAFGLAMPSALLAMRALPVQGADMDNETVAQLSVRLGGVLARASGLRQQLMGAMAIEAGHEDFVPAHHIATVCALSLLDAEMRHTEQTGTAVEISQAMVSSIVLPFASLAIQTLEGAATPSARQGAALPTRLMLLGLLWSEFYRFFDLIADVLVKDSGEAASPTEALVLFLEGVCEPVDDQLNAMVQAAQLTRENPDGRDTASYKKQLLVVVQPLVARVLSAIEQNKTTALFDSVDNIMAGVTTLLEREFGVLRTGILLLLQAHQERVTGAQSSHSTTSESEEMV